MPRLTLTKAQAAAALQITEEEFEQHVESQLRVVYVGERELYSVAELKRWIAAQGEQLHARGVRS